MLAFIDRSISMALKEVTAGADVPLGPSPFITLILQEENNVQKAATVHSVNRCVLMDFYLKLRGKTPICCLCTFVMPPPYIA
jgi:hypothetical protein